ncbi:hypothetical protein BXZ70DRAFT_1078252 [Cristinia sonorae]|uniref:EH domain-containing protein n=1 Tax=Cristinia sonorae TaxID=1940300 RepID=A0A8K0XP31_9AGAR|nr:hypothetical protein BXZ70DRAFT_1078252 [Cristinia sonorae]
MASSSIQSRVAAFEALATNNIPSSSSSTTPAALRPSPSPSPPILGRKTSLIDLKDDWEIDSGPVYNVSYATRNKSYPSVVGSSSSKPTPRHVSDSRLLSYASQSTPLIHLETAPKPKTHAPPLPPRKPSYGSLKSVSNSSTSSLPRSPTGGPSNMALPPMPPPRKKSDSLTVDAYPHSPGGKLGIAIPRGHAPASSISSFHSVSLSSDGGMEVGSPSSTHVATFPMDREMFDGESVDSNGRDADDISIDSFENVSTVSPSVSSISMEWGDYAKRQPPKLPQRPKPPSLPISPSNSGTPSNVPAARISPPLSAKPPPPPPPSRTRPPPASNRSSLASTITSASDHSSVISAATSRTSLSSIRPPLTPKPAPSTLQHRLSRPTPIPPAARARYEAVFVGNVKALKQFERERAKRALSPPPGRKERQAAGWRGLSVDLITNPPAVNDALDDAGSSGKASSEDEVGADERLDGRIVAKIWKLSRLEKSKLKDIWIECDPTGTGSLDRAAFVKGMWRIDEELRRAHLTPALPPRPYQSKPSRPLLR